MPLVESNQIHLVSGTIQRLIVMGLLITCRSNCRNSSPIGNQRLPLRSKLNGHSRSSWYGTCAYVRLEALRPPINT